jgi:hypothetical protein
VTDRPTFAQWLRYRADRLVELGLTAPEDDREDYMKVQARSLVQDTLHFSRMGLADDDPMPPIGAGS